MVDSKSQKKVYFIVGMHKKLSKVDTLVFFVEIFYKVFFQRIKNFHYPGNREMICYCYKIICTEKGLYKVESRAIEVTVRDWRQQGGSQCSSSS